MKSKLMSVGLLVLVMALGVQAAIYDDFNIDDNWAYKTGTSTNGKWTYDYRSNPDWAPVGPSGGSLKFYTASGSGPVVTSTQTWNMPTNVNESLTFKFKVSNLNWGDAYFTAHWIWFVGDTADMAVAGPWGVTSGNWSFLEKPEWGWNSTGVSVPTNSVWDSVTVKYYRTPDDLRWQIQIERPGMATYSTDRTLYSGMGNTTVGLKMASEWGKVQYDYVDVAYVPEPATMTLLACGLVGLLRRKN